MGLKLNLGMEKPDNGVAVATSVQKVGFNYLSRWFISLGFEDKKTLGLKLFQIWTNLTTLLLEEGKVREFGLKLRIEKTKVAAHKWQKNVWKVVKNTFSDKFL